MLRWLPYMIMLLLLPVRAVSQSCADCAIGIPALQGYAADGSNAELVFSMTGLAGNCTDTATSPQWTVTGQAAIDGPAGNESVLVRASGPFNLHLDYSQTSDGESSTCSLLSGVPYRPNPTWSSSCGLNLILVLDESNSISYTQENLVRQAVVGLLQSLAGSGAHVAIVEFSTRAEAEVPEGCGVPGSPHYAEVTDETINGCLWNYLATDYGITPSGGTNWDDALVKVRQVIAGNTLQPDLVLFITDGNPTFYINEDAGNALGGSGSQAAVSSVMHAMAQANAVKETAPIFAVGVGNSVSMGNLEMISGNRPFTGNAATSDYLSLQNFQALAANLQQVANAFCAPSLDLRQTWSPCIMAPEYRLSVSWVLENTGSLDAANVRLAVTPPLGFTADSMVCSVADATVREESGQWVLDAGLLGVEQEIHWTWFGRLAGPGAANFSATATAQDVPSPLLQSGTPAISDLRAGMDVLAHACGETPNGALELDISGGLPPYEVVWSTGQTSFLLEGLAIGPYSARVRDANGCETEVWGAVGPAETVPLYVPLEASALELCPLGKVVLSGPEGFPAYQWFLDGQALALTDQPRWEVDETGDYTLYIEDNSICGAGMSEPLFIDEAYPLWEYDTLYVDVQAVFGEEGMPLCPAGHLNLHPEDWGAYQWQQASGSMDFRLDDGTRCLVPQTAFPAWQADTLTLQVCESDGCASCARLVWVISPPAAPELPEDPGQGPCRVPQAITPNGDGLNDYLVITCPDPAYQPEIQIYNRWGNEVYRSDQYENDWQGTYKGAPLPEGTYYYSVVSGYRQGRPIVSGGFISLVR